LSEIKASINNIRIQWIVALLGLLALCILLWGPFGLNHVGLVEEWTFYKAHAAGVVPPGIPPNRLILFTYLGYLLTPDSFMGLYLLIAASTLLKGVLLFSILKRFIRNSAPLAFAITFLWIIYPADTGVFNPRDEAYQLAIITYLLALFVLLRWWDTRRVMYLILIWASQIVCLMTVEMPYPLIFATPIILIWLEKRLSRRVIWYTAIWLVVPTVMLVWTFNLFINNALSYQSGVIDTSLSSTSSLLSIFLSFGYLYLQHFALGWLLALASPLDIGFKILAVIVGLMAGILTYIQTKTLHFYHIPHLRRWAYSGLVIMALGYVTFMVSKNHRELMDRVFTLSSAGAALTLIIAAWSLVMYLPVARRRVAFSIAVGVLAAWAALWAYERQKDTVRYSDLETKILTGITRQMPSWSAQHIVMVLFDRTGTLATGDIMATFGNTVILDNAELKFGGNSTSRHFQDAIRFIYNSDNIDAVLCFPDTMTQRASLEQCEFRTDNFVFRSQSMRGGIYPYDEVIAFEYTGDIRLLSTLTTPNGQVIANYQPERIINTSAPLPHRYFTLFPGIDQKSQGR
jgi:hypothetical protein